MNTDNTDIPLSFAAQLAADHAAARLLDIEAAAASLAAAADSATEAGADPDGAMPAEQWSAWRRDGADLESDDAPPAFGTFGGFDVYRDRDDAQLHAEETVLQRVRYDRTDDESPAGFAPVGTSKDVWSVVPFKVTSADGKRSATVQGAYQSVTRAALAILSRGPRPATAPVFACYDKDGDLWDEEGEPVKVQAGSWNAKGEPTRPTSAGALIGYTAAVVLPTRTRDAVASIIGGCPPTLGAATAAVLKWCAGHAGDGDGKKGTDGLLARAFAVLTSGADDSKKLRKEGVSEERGAKCSADLSPAAVARMLARGGDKRTARTITRKGGKRARSLT